MYINRFKNEEVFIRAGGKDLEIFNSDGVIFSFKMFKYFAVINFVLLHYLAGISLRNTQEEAFSNHKEILSAVRAKICLQK